jgi:cell division protein FtsZ
MQGARGVIINVTGGPDLSLMEVNEALTVIQEAAHEDANIIFGAVVDPSLAAKVKITVIATGFDHASRIHSAGATVPMQTPVDLQSYTSPYGGRPSSPSPAEAPPPRFVISRRQPVDPPLSQSRPALAMAGLESTTGSDDPADIELNLELEVPAFLRRNEG